MILDWFMGLPFVGQVFVVFGVVLGFIASTFVAANIAGSAIGKSAARVANA